MSNMNKIMELIREEAKKYEKSDVMLPVELVAVIEGRKKEASWQNINTAKVLRYVADMMEE